MAREPKAHMNFTCRLAKDAAELLQEIIDKTDYTKTVVVEHAIREYYNNHFVNIFSDNCEK